MDAHRVVSVGVIPRREALRPVEPGRDGGSRTQAGVFGRVTRLGENRVIVRNFRFPRWGSNGFDRGESRPSVGKVWANPNTAGCLIRSVRVELAKRRRPRYEPPRHHPECGTSVSIRTAASRPSSSLRSCGNPPSPRSSLRTRWSVTSAVAAMRYARFPSHVVDPFAGDADRRSLSSGTVRANFRVSAIRLPA